MAVIIPIKPGTLPETENYITIRPTPPLTGLILPPETDMEFQIAPDHAADPIKDVQTIDRISQYLIDNKRYRDNMLFVVGINVGLRVSDLLQLTFYHFIDENYSFRRVFPILEKKTRNTRKVAKNRYITINEAVIEAITLYLKNHPSRLDEYLFKSESNRGSNQNRAMNRVSVDRILKGIAKELDLTEKISTHTLRKTFGYHQMVMSGNDHRKLLVLQKIFGHASASQTLDYIGITGNEIEEAYLTLNLGSKSVYSRFSSIGERTTA